MHEESIEALPARQRHYGKMIANLIPLLAMLTTGERIRGYVENGIANLLLRSILNYLDAHLAAGWEEDVQRFARTVKQADEGKINVRRSLGPLVAYYGEVLRST